MYPVLAGLITGLKADKGAALKEVQHLITKGGGTVLPDLPPLPSDATATGSAKKANKGAPAGMVVHTGIP
jgi:hypothetical protein